MSNIGRAIIQKLVVKFEGEDILCIDDFDIFACYRDLWKTKSEMKNAIRQGIISIDSDLTLNCMKLRINAGDKSTTPQKIMLLQKHMVTNSTSLLTLKC